MEIKNRLTVTTEEEEGVTGKEGEGLSRNMNRGLMDKDNGGGRIECGRWGWVGQRRVMGG